MGINDYVKMAIFLCLICFPLIQKINLPAKMATKNVGKMIFGKNLQMTPMNKYFVEIALSRTLPKINAFLHFTQNFMKSNKNGRKQFLAKSGR